MPVPFDVALLAAARGPVPDVRVAPFLPMLSQGWTLLSAGDPMALDIHDTLRREQVPSIWTTLTPEGTDRAAAYVVKTSS